MAGRFDATIMTGALLLLPVLGACGSRPTPISSPTPTPGAASRSVETGISVRSVECVGITVSSTERLADFYEHVLAFREAVDPVRGGQSSEQPEGTPGPRFRRRKLDLGSECVELIEPLGGSRRRIPDDSRSNDLWFQHVAIVVRDMDAAYATLEANHVTHVSPVPQTLPAWNQNAANIRAYYFKDPDGHTLELLWFPPDKGQPRWHPPPGAGLFLGIDHTAIASGSTEASLTFYVGRLGLHVVGRSDNFGPEQERLSGVPGAHVRITALRADSGPGIELLEYLAPPGGRPIPRDERADDLTHWRTVMTSDGVTARVALRDPDGHTMEIEPR
ncbi:MAG: VOC family protein [Polyangiaceae bacterium]|jgi:catechol 2,3-dioxygenase-like lactoylglutathione lyase family enzyme